MLSPRRVVPFVLQAARLAGVNIYGILLCVGAYFPGDGVVRAMLKAWSVRPSMSLDILAKVCAFSWFKDLTSERIRIQN